MSKADENAVNTPAEDIDGAAAAETAKKKKGSSKEKKDKNEALKKELEAAKEEAANSKDLLLRTAAEFENYKRRTQLEKDRIGADTRAATLKDLLPVLGNLDRATANADASAEDLKKGLEMTMKQLWDTLSRLGLEEIDAMGKEFDPNFHYAVSRTEDDSVGDNTVVAVFQKGYKIGENVVRPAMVTVANC